MCRRETGGIVDWDPWRGGGECVLTELHQLLTSTGGGRLVVLGCRRSLSLGWVVDFGYRRSLCTGTSCVALIEAALLVMQCTLAYFN